MYTLIIAAILLAITAYELNRMGKYMENTEYGQ